jgi:hypothetical protein
MHNFNKGSSLFNKVRTWSCYLVVLVTSTKLEVCVLN